MPKREFVLTNGTKFIKQDADGKYKQTTSIGLADIYDSYALADNIRKNSLPKSLSRTYRIIEIRDGELLLQAITPTEKKRTGEVVHFNNTFGDSEWCKSFEGLDTLFERATKRGYELSQEVQDVDLEISDVVHYIEFNNLNAREGYKIYKRLNELLCKRRHLKFEQKIVSSINRNHKASDYISDIIATIKECTNDVYKPRIATDLFREVV